MRSGAKAVKGGVDAHPRSQGAPIGTTVNLVFTMSRFVRLVGLPSADFPIRDKKMTGVFKFTSTCRYFLRKLSTIMLEFVLPAFRFAKTQPTFSEVKAPHADIVW